MLKTFDKKSFSNILTSLFSQQQSTQQISREIVVVVHQLKKFFDIEHQYFILIKHFIKFFIKNICRRHFRAFFNDFDIDRIRFASFKIEFRSWLENWSMNKSRFKKTIKIFETIVTHLIFIHEKKNFDNVFIDEFFASFKKSSSISTSFDISVSFDTTFIFDITKVISRNDMFSNSSFFFDFFDVQRHELTKIIINVFVNRFVDDDNESNFSLEFETNIEF